MNFSSPENQKQINSNEQSLFSGYDQVPLMIKILLLVFIALTSFLTVFVPGLLFPLIFACICAALCAVYHRLNHSLFWLVAPIAVALAAGLIDASILSALYALFPLPMALALVFSMMYKTKKTVAISFTAFALSITILILFAVLVYSSFGTITPTILRDLYNSYFTELHEIMSASFRDNPALNTDELQSIAAKLLDASITAMKLMTPGFFAITVQFFAWIAVNAYVFTANRIRCPRLYPRGYVFRVSRLTALLLIVFFIIGMFSSDNSMMYHIANNMVLTLLPGLFCMGCISLKRRAKNPLQRRSLIFSIVLIVLAFFFAPSFIPFVFVVDGIGEIFSVPYLIPKE
ncbi:MAG: hypothetical protein IJC98_02945 [Clostridia bacterium]|nr:hypothetical protein [Clostridia bacterium]